MSFTPIAEVFARPRADDSLVGWRAGEPVTWAQFRSRIAAVASHVESDAVLTCEKPLNFLAALLALWSKRRVALVPPSLHSTSEIAAPPIGDAEVENTTGSVELSLPEARQCRLALYTSGSTGTPKRVDKTLAQLDRELENLQACWGNVLADSAVLATVPHHHIYGLLFRLLWPLAAGRPADEATSGDAVEVRAAARKRGRHVLVSTPAQLARFPGLLALGEWQRPEIIFSSGGPLAPETAALYRAGFGAAPVEVFGSTETGGVAWRQRDGGANEDVWQTFPGLSVATDADGALLLDSPYLPTRSWRMDDGAKLLGNGRFVLLGRLDRVVKIEGKRLSLPELEQRLQTHEWVQSAAAVPLPAPKRLGVAVVATREGAAALEKLGVSGVGKALRKHLAPHFDATLLPKRFRFVKELPISERGKVISQELVQLFS